MKNHAELSRALRVVLIGAGLTIGTGLVAAQELKEIAVEAARATKVVGRTPVGAPVEEVTLTRHVAYADLDLTTYSGVTEFERRVHDAAATACKQLDELYPLTASESPACTKKANDAAMVEVHRIVEAAQKNKE